MTGVARVIDGDTLAIGEVRIRLHGIDAPEMGQPCADMRGRELACGEMSKAALSAMAVGNMTCEARDLDRYGRIVAVCRVAGRDLNAAMVAQGAAFAYAKYSKDYVQIEARARREGRGFWRAGVQVPAQYRASKYDAPAPVAVTGCTIKGNISKSGHIYHVEGSRSYAKTRIDTTKGERWFCSEAEARAAGWRAPRS